MNEDATVAAFRFVSIRVHSWLSAINVVIVAFLIQVMLCGLESSALAVAAPEELLAEASREYRLGMEATGQDARRHHFERAAVLFAQVANEHPVANAELYVNLGNASLQCEDLGGAILAYRRALLIAPAHRRARQNLDHAREMMPRFVPLAQRSTFAETFFFWDRQLAPGGRALLRTLAFVCAAALAAVWVRWRRAWARNMAIVVLLVWMGLFAMSIWERRSARMQDVVVTAPQVVVRSADADGAAARFAQPLPAGTEGRLVESRDNWLRIRLANDQEGWVRASAVTLVGLQ